jgi:ADP-heptose:LPS heptosyltransferase
MWKINARREEELLYQYKFMWNERIKKIAVLRANALGDLILSLPSLEALKKSYPEAEVVLLGRSSHAKFYEGLIGPIDRIIPIPSYIQFDKGIYSPSVVRDGFIKSLQDEEFDLAIQLHGGGKYSNGFLQMIRAKKTIGAKTPDAPDLDVSLPYLQFHHEVLRELEIVEKAGAHYESITPRIFLHATALDKARQFLSKNITNESSPSSYILINPGATDPRRRWPPGKFAFLSEALRDKGLKVLINIGPSEDHLIHEIKSCLSNSQRIYFISPELDELSGLISLCSLVISNDTGTLHLAMALGVPSVALFWYRNLLNYGPMSAKNTRVLISWQTTCPICHINCIESNCEHRDSLIADIKEQGVVEASNELLNIL